MEYDLLRLYDHPSEVFEYIPSALVVFEKATFVQTPLQVDWSPRADGETSAFELLLTWDIRALRDKDSQLDRRVQTRRKNDRNYSKHVEEAGVVVAVAAMACIEPDTRFTVRSGPLTRHDYHLNDTEDEMIEIAGRSSESLEGLFTTKKKQSDKNASLRKRWVSVTVFYDDAGNITKGLHA